MAETQHYLIVKSFEPEGAYAASLRTLPGEEEDLTPDLDAIVKLREMTPEDAETVAARQHIISVEPDSIKSVPEPIVGPEAEATGAVTADQAQAWHNIPPVVAAGYRGKGVKVAILDTGLAQDAANKLAGRVVAHESMISGEDWVDTGSSSHGTWCAGTIADIAPDCQLIIIKVLSSTNGSGSDSGIIAGINRAVALGAGVISESLGGGAAPALDAAVNAARAKGVLMPCAAGNEQQGKTSYTADSSSPAEATGAETVAAVDISGNIAYFSNWGNSLDVAAIGVQIVNQWQPGAWSGTSMATPHVAGILALLLSTGKGPDATEKALYAGARDTALPAYEEGHGIADAFASLKTLAAITPILPPAPPGPINVSLYQLYSDREKYVGHELNIYRAVNGAAVKTWHAEPVT